MGYELTRQWVRVDQVPSSEPQLAFHYYSILFLGVFRVADWLYVLPEYNVLSVASMRSELSNRHQFKMDEEAKQPSPPPEKHGNFDSLPQSSLCEQQVV